MERNYEMYSKQEKNLRNMYVSWANFMKRTQTKDDANELTQIENVCRIEEKSSKHTNYTEYDSLKKHATADEKNDFDKNAIKNILTSRSFHLSHSAESMLTALP